MNSIYKVVWNEARNCCVVASELAKRHTKGCGARSLSRAAVTVGIVAGLTIGMTGSAWVVDAGKVTVTVGADKTAPATVTGSTANGVSTLVTLEAESITFTGNPVITGVNSLATIGGVSVGATLDAAHGAFKVDGATGNTTIGRKAGTLGETDPGGAC
jgi:hypothetical protein